MTSSPISWRLPLAIVTALSLVATACSDDAAPDTICVVVDGDNGSTSLECDDGTSIDVTDGTPGDDGTTCTASENGDGTVDVDCDDGTSVTISNGDDGQGCSVVTEADGSVTISCEDGGETTVDPGDDGDSCTVSEEEGDVSISCTDGTEATVQDGEPGGTCSVADGEDGVTITCDDGSTVDVTNGEEGGDCTVTTEPESGDLVVECENGTSVVIVEGGNDATLFGVATLAGTDDHTGILVEVEDTTFSATTDAAGDYEITGVPPGNYAVNFSFGDYNDVRLTNVTAVPGLNELPDVTLTLDERIARADDVFIVDVCTAEDGETATGIVWLEEYELITELFSSPQGGLGFEYFVRPGVNALPLLAIGRLVFYDMATGERETLGFDVVNVGVECSPDGASVAFLEDVNLSTSWEGDLYVWNGSTRTFVESETSSCGLEWNSTSTAVAFLVELARDQDQISGFGGDPEGVLLTYSLGDESGPALVGFGVRCFDVFTDAFFNDGGPPIEILEQGVFYDDPFYEWSPNGTNLRYESYFGEGGEMSYFRLNDEDNDTLTEFAFWDPGQYSPNGDWIVYWDYEGLGEEAFIFDTTADADAPDAETQISDNGAYDAPFFAWSPDSSHVAHTDNTNTASLFDLEVWEVGEGQAGQALALNMSDFAWTWAPDDTGVLFAAEEPNLPITPAGNGGAIIGTLAFWDVGSELVVTPPYSTSVDTRTLEASYSPDGSRMVFVEYNGESGSPGDVRLVEDGSLVEATLRTGVVNYFDPGFPTVWGPDNDSVVAFESFDSEIWLYSFSGASNSLVADGPIAEFLPVEYNDDGSAFIVFDAASEGPPDRAGFGGFIPFAVTIDEWNVDAVTSETLTDSGIFGTYGATGASAFFIEADTESLSSVAPKGQAQRWTSLGTEADLLNGSIDILSNFAAGPNEAVYVIRNFGYPEVEDNGVYIGDLP